MSGNQETNVRLPVCAHEALAAVAVRRGASRDETIRQLLTVHVQSQECLDPDDRRTHIGTVLRYPRPPLFRTHRRSDPPLRLRAPASLLARARKVSLQLPGQYERSHGDYQGRLLTDAVITAIAVAEPFTDDFLEGLLPLLRHKSALGLWRLATAATSTVPERKLLGAAGEERRRTFWPSGEAPDRTLLLVAEALENDVAWHSPARFTVAENIARDLLAGADAKRHEEQFHQQGWEWEELYQDTLHAAGDRLSSLLAGTNDYDYTGRGGTAVWRARRRVSLQDFEEWLVQRPHGSSLEWEMDPPGWMLRLPGRWHAHDPALRDGHLPEPYAGWVAEGKLVSFPFRDRVAVWPLRGRSDGPGWEPVRGIELVLAAAADLKPEQVIGFIEAALIVWDHQRDGEPAVDFPAYLPADKARAFGLITAEQQREAMAEARALTMNRMEAVIEAFAEDPDCSAGRLDRLREARGNAREFGRLARDLDKWIGAKFRVARAVWLWPGGSAAEALGEAEPEFVQYLAAWAHRTAALGLEQSMHAAWQRAFDQYGRRM
ncbi:hypothetical protein [Streptomyces sp. H34-S4]|uniref:hypothetical protein n=1 Tax=Streptomyces sp. H34-S4 TaxID=2996463 RepID=UPI002271414D|nr:hypothetical protein [Streptomyces sp. H34-S4]MCY0937637.1 hypothetical protein [Streptomyces sp. H34-S4]